MQFGWKVLIPVSLVWIMIVSTLRVMSQQGAPRVVVVAFTFGILLLVFSATSLVDKNKARIKAENRESLKNFPAPSFPVPSLPGKTLNGAEEING